MCGCQREESRVAVLVVFGFIVAGGGAMLGVGASIYQQWLISQENPSIEYECIVESTEIEYQSFDGYYLFVTVNVTIDGSTYTTTKLWDKYLRKNDATLVANSLEREGVVPCYYRASESEIQFEPYNIVQYNVGTGTMIAGGACVGAGIIMLLIWIIVDFSVAKKRGEALCGYERKVYCVPDKPKKPKRSTLENEMTGRKEFYEEPN